MSPLTRLYLAFSQFSDPIWRIVHRKRLQKGKELEERLPEKYGLYFEKRPGGEVIWLHALSVGESLALVPLIEKALKERPKSHVVLTTSTVTSISALERAELPERVTHVMLPIDTQRAVSRFLDYWDPSLAVFAELDFWPRLMIDTHRRSVPMVLVNSRMSEKSRESRSRLGRLTRDVLELFDHLLLQDETSRDRFVSLGADPKKIKVIGALKAAARPLPASTGDLEDLRRAIGRRPVWLGAATHPAEEPLVIRAHKLICEREPKALLVIAPRYMESADQLETVARQAFSTVSRRGRGETVRENTQVYIADTIGEMGLWYRVAPISFVGHSLAAPNGQGGGGKNPYEAMALGSMVLHGPAVSDFSETYDKLSDTGAAVAVQDSTTLAEAVVANFDPSFRAPVLEAADSVLEDGRDVLDRTWAVLAQALAR